MRRLFLRERAMHILCGFRGLVLRSDRYYIRGDANRMGHQGQQIPQPRTRPLFLLSACFSFTVSAFTLTLWFVCDRRAMGSGMTSTRARMMAAGSLSGTTLAVNLMPIPAGRKVCTGQRHFYSRVMVGLVLACYHGLKFHVMSKMQNFIYNFEIPKLYMKFCIFDMQLLITEENYNKKWQ